jgi:uncharacterized membrane protein YphA (DoxX/SURF4 family)
MATRSIDHNYRPAPIATPNHAIGVATGDGASISGLLVWLSVLRAITGAVFIYMGTMHAISGWASGETFQQVMTRMASGSPFGWYTGLFGPLLTSGAPIIGPLFTFGMIATGIGIAVGLFTRVAIIAGLWLNLNALLIGFGAGGVHHGLNVLMAAVQVAVWQTGAWRAYSVDGIVHRRCAEQI